MTKRVKLNQTGNNGSLSNHWGAAVPWGRWHTAPKPKSVRRKEIETRKGEGHTIDPKKFEPVELFGDCECRQISYSYDPDLGGKLSEFWTRGQGQVKPYVDKA